MLICKRRYRNAALKIYVEPGEVLREITPQLEEHLMRDAPGCFEVYEPKAKSKGLDAPPVDKMMAREDAERKSKERGHGEVMDRHNMAALVRPKAE